MTEHRFPKLPAPPRRQSCAEVGSGLTDPMRYRMKGAPLRTFDKEASPTQRRLPPLNDILISQARSTLPATAFSNGFGRVVRSETDLAQIATGVSTASGPLTPSSSQRYSRTQAISPTQQMFPDTIRDRDTMHIHLAKLQIGQSQDRPTNIGRFSCGSFSSCGDLYEAHQFSSNYYSAHTPTSCRSHSISTESTRHGSASPESFEQSLQDFPIATSPRRVVHEEIIPGEGPCYIFADGSHVRKMNEREPTNAQWGVTKAGKPRKRLAIACMTCRQKKMKCEPGEGKCIQCYRSGRDCHFYSAPRRRKTETTSASSSTC